MEETANGESAWRVLTHLDGYKKLTDALEWIDAQKKEGMFRVVQTQRMVRMEKVEGKLRQTRKHAMSAESLMRTCKAMERQGIV